MKIVADLHVHIYPEYSFIDFFKICFEKIEKLNFKIGVICLTETNNCNYYEEFSNKVCLAKKYKIIELDNCKILFKDSISLIIFPGFQIHTKENIELLALFVKERIISGVNLKESIDNISKVNGIAVINWAPGKWFGKRGELIKDYILNSKELVFIGDTSHRPLFCPLFCPLFSFFPKLMKLGLEKGFKVIYGSDPMPFNREEKEVFSYYSVYNIEEDIQELNEENINKFVNIIKDKILNTQAEPGGNRNFIFKFIYRQVMLRLVQ